MFTKLRRQTKKSVGAGAALTVLAMFACTNVSTRPISSGDLRQKLETYGRSHPECRLWTDWQSLCSRTGRDGQLRCVIDADRPIRPSEPFCVQGLTVGVLRGEASNPLARRSRARFCEIAAQPGADPDERNSIDPVCETYASDRPFNGRRIASLRHPWCDTWGDSQSLEPVCSESVAGTNNCSSLAARRYEHDKLVICLRWSPGVSCRSPVGGAALPRPEEGIMVGRALRSESAPAWGTYCAD